MVDVREHRPSAATPLFGDGGDVLLQHLRDGGPALRHDRLLEVDAVEVDRVLVEAVGDLHPADEDKLVPRLEERAELVQRLQLHFSDAIALAALDPVRAEFLDVRL